MDIYTSFHVQLKSCVYFSSTVGKLCSYHSHEFILYMDNMQGNGNLSLRLDGDQLNREARRGKYKSLQSGI